MNEPKPDRDAELVDDKLDKIYNDIVNAVEKTSLDESARRARAALKLIERVRVREEQETARAFETIDESGQGELGHCDPGPSQGVKYLPDSIGRFAVKRLIGQGGFGLVFLASDPNLQRDIALKIPRPEAIATAELKARFVREGKAAAALAHPNIVPVYESGQFDAICYLASEFVDGATLDQWFEQQEDLTFIEVATVCRTIAEAIAHAHQRGVMHRDIKPANILVAADSTLPLAERIKIADFGLAKSIDDDNNHTQSGALIGTPSFMATEQAMQQPSTTASDVYSVGAVLYWLLTGKPPFAERNIIETIQSIIKDEIVRPRKLNNDVPADLEAICLKCLEKNPQDRYLNAFGLADDLDNWLQGMPVIARRPAWAERSWRWLKTNRTIATFAATIFGFLLTMSIITASFWLKSNENWKRSEKNRIQALQQTAVAKKQTLRVRKAVERLFQVVSDEPRLKFADMTSFRKKLYDSANTFLQELVNDRPDDDELVDDYVTTLLAGARLFSELGFAKEALDLLNSADTALNENEGDFTSLHIAIKSVRADVFVHMGDANSAVKLKQEVVAYCKELFFEGKTFSSRQYAIELADAAWVAITVGNYKLAQEYNDRETELLAELHNASPLDWPAEFDSAKCIATRAIIATNRRDYERAEELCDKAIEIYQQIGADDEVSLMHMAKTIQQLGISYSYRNEMDTAMQQMQRAEELLLSPSLVDTRSGLQALSELKYDQALCAYKIAEHEQSLRDLDLAIESAKLIQQRFPEAYDPMLEIRPMHLKYGVFHAQSKPEEAAKQLADAVLAAEVALENNNQYRKLRIELAGMYTNLSTFHFTQQQWESANEILDDALAVCQPLHEEDPNNVTLLHYSNALANKAAVAEKLKDAETELEYLIKFLEVAKQDDRFQGMSRNLIRVYAKVGQFENAIIQMKKLVAETEDNSRKFELAKAIAEAAHYFSIADDARLYFKQAAESAINILTDLNESGFSMNDQSMIELMANEEFDSIRDQDNFPNRD